MSPRDRPSRVVEGFTRDQDSALYSPICTNLLKPLALSLLSVEPSPPNLLLLHVHRDHTAAQHCAITLTRDATTFFPTIPRVHVYDTTALT